MAYAGDVPRTMASRFDNTCQSCGEKINKGDMIVWYSQSHTVVHTLCSGPKMRLLSATQYAQAKARNEADTKSLATAIRLTRNLDKTQAEYDAFFNAYPHLKGVSA